MRSATLFLIVLLVSACAHHGDRKEDALLKLRTAPSAVPGMSVEKAVEQVVTDMQSMNRGKVAPGRWYCNRAIELDAEAYKAGYEFSQDGHTARFGWLVRYDDDKIEAITDFARQVKP